MKTSLARILTTALRILFGAAFVAVGITHFTSAGSFVAIVPDYLPWAEALVAVSGAAEILLGVLLVVPRTRTLAGWGLIALLIAVFPANINMAAHPDRYHTISRTVLYIRLPVQGVLIALAYWLSRPDRTN